MKLTGSALDNWRHLIGRRNRPAWAVLLASLSLTLLAWFGLYVQTMKSAELQFGLHVGDVIDSIEERMRQHEQILLGGAGLFDASETVDRAGWRAYVERLNLKENYPGIQGVGFSRIIKPAELQAHIAAMRAEGFPDYTVRPPGKRSLYTSIVYLEPFSGRNLAAFGFDMMSESTRAKAMRMAAESGKTAISAKVKLVQETHGKEQAGFLMYVPVYRKYQPLSTPEERWKALQGFVYSPYRVGDLMAGILGKRALKLDFVIFDGVGEAGESHMFLSADERAAGSRATPPKMTTLRVIHGYGQTWTVRLHSRPEFEASFQSPLKAIDLALGGGINVLLFLLVSFLTSQRERAEKMAERMTQDIRINEEKLRQSEARIRAIVDGADHLIITTDTDGVIQSFNRSAENHLGYLAAELVGKSTPAVFHDPDEVLRRAQELTAAGMSVEPGFDVFTARARKLFGGDTHEWTYIRKDGSRFPVSLTVTALRDGHGEINAFLGIATDITERNLAAQMKRDEAARMGAILDNVVDGIITISETGNIESFNKAAMRIFGYSEAEVAGKNIKMLMPEPYHSQHDGYLHNYVSTGVRKIIGIGRQVVGQRRDGSVFPMDLAVSEMLLGNMRKFTGVVRDITERKRAEDELRKLFRAVEQSPVSVVITDASGNIEYVNTKFTEVTGYAAHEVIGRNPRMLQSGVTPAEVYQSMWQTILAGREWRGKLQNRKKNGELFWEEIYISAIRDNGGNTANFVAVKEDITERLEVERMKNEFISTVSHELRTPLTSIRGSLALIAGGVVGELPAAVKPLVDIAHKNSERLILLVNDILDIEKIESGKMEFSAVPVKLMPLLKQALDGNHAYAEQYKVSYELESELPDAMINVDANRMMQVFANLLSNAAKFSPAGSKVAVAVERTGQRIRIAVKDNGPGIPDEFRGRIFQKFAQADSSDTRKKGGTGLGLSITKAIVEQMGGSIGFDSQPNVQTVFYVEFPEWHDQAASQSQPQLLPGQVVSGSGQTRHKILHVEDDPDVFHVVNSIASGVAEMAYAGTLAEARQMLAESRYDLVILDLKLPDGSGKELLPQLKEASPPIPVLIFSAYDVDLEDAREAGAVLMKSRTGNAQLLATIKQLIGY